MWVRTRFQGTAYIKDEPFPPMSLENGGHLQGGYLILLVLAVLLDIGVFSGGRRAMKRK